MPRQSPAADLRAVFADFPAVGKESFFDVFPKHFLEERVRQRIAEQIVDTPALSGVEEHVFTACRLGVGWRLGWSVACRCGAGRRMIPRVTCPSTKSYTAGTDSRVLALWMPRDRGRWGTTFCTAGTDSCFFYALWRPRFCGKLRDQLVEVPKIEQRTFEQSQVVDFLTVGEVKLVPQERVRQRVDCNRNSRRC